MDLDLPKNTHKNKVLYVIAFIVFLGVTTVSLIAFNTYKPQVKNQPGDVKGASSFFPPIAIMVDAKETTKTETFSTKNITYTTQKSQEDILIFYKNVFEDTEWKLEEIKPEENGTLVVYKNDNQFIYIHLQNENNQTKVSVDTVI